MSQNDQNNINLSDTDISTIEAKISEELLLATEELMDIDIIIVPQEISKGVYETVVEERSIRYDTFIVLTGNNIKTQKCNCVAWKTQGSCKHIIAAIFAIRSLLANQIIAANKKKRKSTRRSTSIDTLINQVPAEELQLFIRSYARKDKVFKLLLQGTFVNLLSQDELSSYIESTLPILTKANEKVTPRQISIFLQAVEVLEQQFKAYISQRDYIYGYRLIFLILRKSFYIKSKLKTDRPKFDSAHSHLINNYLETLNLIEAPEYKEFLYTELKELLGASYITSNTPEEHQLWLSIYRDKTKHDMLTDLIVDYNRHNHVDIDSGYFMKMLDLLMVKKTERQKRIQNGDLQEAYRILQLLQRYKDLDRAVDTMKTYFVSKPLSNPLAKLVLGLLNKESDSILIDTCIGYYLKFKNNVYLDWIKSNSLDWKASSIKLIDAIQAKKDSFLEVQFHLANDATEAAIAVIKEHNNWSLIANFDEELHALNPEICIDLYKHHLKAYLADHFGIQAKDYTQVVFQRVYRVGREKARKSVATFIHDEFGERGLY